MIQDSQRTKKVLSIRYSDSIPSTAWFQASQGAIPPRHKVVRILIFKKKKEKEKEKHYPTVQQLVKSKSIYKI